DLGAKDGNAQYELVVTVQRQQGVAARIGAKITGALASVARINNGEDRVTISFDRTVPHAPAFVDYVNVDLSGTPAGRYSVSVTINDKVSGGSVTRTRAFVVQQ
ncbi:MAG TPA: hypothetical protein VE967_08745, partial [Gemmatimonadaceae bacterium]|nr:hypothetical protein [Gemmatimonadaceae bacterium]